MADTSITIRTRNSFEAAVDQGLRFETERAKNTLLALTDPAVHATALHEVHRRQSLGMTELDALKSVSYDVASSRWNPERDHPSPSEQEASPMADSFISIPADNVRTQWGVYNDHFDEVTPHDSEAEAREKCSTYETVVRRFVSEWEAPDRG